MHCGFRARKGRKETKIILGFIENDCNDKMIKKEQVVKITWFCRYLDFWFY